MNQQQQKFFQIVYSVIHNSERSEKRQAEKSQYKVRTGYIGQRYKCVPGENRKYFTTKSVYTRHKEISQKYKYNFDPQQSKALIFLKRKWNEQLFNYLSQFGSGFYVKKQSSKDKRLFKLQNDFKIKQNPLFRMLSLLDKLNYLFLVVKLSHVFKKMTQHNSGKSCQLEADNDVERFQQKKSSQISQATQQDEHQITDIDDSEGQDSEKQTLTPMYKIITLPTQDKKNMKAFDSYRDQGYHGRSIMNKFYKKQEKSIAWIKKTHRKHLTKDSIYKIIQNIKEEYTPGSY